MRNSKNYWLFLVGASVFLCPTLLLAGDVTLANSFTAGTLIQSAQINANFEALRAGVNTRLEGKSGRRAYTFVGGGLFTGTITPPAGFSFNSSGGAITATHYGVGSYGVNFGNMPNAEGTAQVTASGSAFSVCKIENWYTNLSNELEMNVDCYGASGAPADSGFVVQWSD